MSSWQKVPQTGKGKAPPHWLEVRTGAFVTSYRVRYRRDGVSIEQVLEGDFKRWEDARDLGEALIAKARFGEKEKPRNLVQSEALCDELVKLKEPLDEDTHEQIEIFMRLHIKPFLRGECAYENDTGSHQPCPHRSYLENGASLYAADLNPTKWLAYKTHLRLHRPTTSLFNHWKFWSMLCKYAFEKQVLKEKFKLAYDEEKEDFRKPGQIIPTELIAVFLKTANRTWMDRILLGRLTGQRPSVLRNLRKDQVNLETGVCVVEKTDSKNRRHYDFILPGPAISILKARILQVERVKDSPYFFPMETDPTRPMDKHLSGWHSAWKRARNILAEESLELERKGDQEGAVRRHQLAALIDLEEDSFTPHDLRHTYLTHKFKTSKNPALVCYSCDLSLEEAMETYIHFEAEDTRPLAEETAREAATWMPAIGYVKGDETP